MSRYIDADDLEQKLVEKGQASKRYKLGEIWELNGAELRDVIRGIPTANVRENVKGEWLHTPTWWIYCSVCGKEPPNESNVATDFCPNCGADMRGGTE